MKNRLFWFLLLVLIIFVAFVYLINRQESQKNIKKETSSWSTQSEQSKATLTKILDLDKKETNSWKIENLKWNQSNFAFFDVDGEKFSFNIIDQKLELKIWEQSLGFFEIVLKNDLNVLKIFWESGLFLIEIGEKKYIYSKNNWFLKNFETKLNINYAKISESNLIIFSENKWTFVLYKDKTELEYFSLFDDFIFYKDWFIWIIWASDSEKKKRFFINDSKNILYFYDPIAKIWKIIYKLDFLPKKFWEGNSEIVLENEKWEKFSLKNY